MTEEEKCICHCHIEKARQDMGQPLVCRCIKNCKHCHPENFNQPHNFTEETKQIENILPYTCDFIRRHMDTKENAEATIKSIDQALQAERDRLVGEIENLQKMIIGGRRKWQMHHLELVKLDLIDDIIRLIQQSK